MGVINSIFRGSLLFLSIALCWFGGFARAEETASAATAADSALPVSACFVALMELQMPPGEASPAQLEALSAHVAHLKSLFDQGVLLLAGPFEDASSQGMSVLRASSLEEARAICESDPTVQLGLMKIIAVHPWWVPFNAWEGSSMSREQFIEMMAAPPAVTDEEPAAQDSAAEQP